MYYVSTAKEQAAKLKSYTSLRRQREEFRKKLVSLITSPEHDRDMDVNEGNLSSEEKELLRYYYYIKHGVDTIHVAPLDRKVLNRVLRLIPQCLLKYEECLTQSIDDVKEDFMLAVKKAIVDFVLQDPANTKSLKDTESPFQMELHEIGNSYRQFFDNGKLKMFRNLNIINPCINALLDVWYSKFR